MGLKLGDVVRYVGTPARGPSDSRGIVVWLDGRGEYLSAPPIRFGNDAVIEHAPGYSTVTNTHDEWEIIPNEERSTPERVRAVWLAWEPPSWDEPGESDSLEFALLRALLTSAEADRIFADDAPHWPTSVYELSLRLAHEIDDRVAWARRLAAALAR